MCVLLSCVSVCTSCVLCVWVLCVFVCLGVRVCVGSVCECGDGVWRGRGM